MIITETNSTLEQNLRTEYVGSHPINAVPEVDIIENLKINMDQLEELCAQLNFVMREIRTVMKI